MDLEPMPYHYKIQPLLAIEFSIQTLRERHVQLYSIHLDRVVDLLMFLFSGVINFL